MTEYRRAYTDSFLIGLGAMLMNVPWMVTNSSLLPKLAAAVNILVMLFVLPWVMVALHR